MQKLVTRNIRDERLGHDTYIYNNLPTNQVSPHKLQCTIIQVAVENKNFHFSFPRYYGASVSTSHHIT